MDVLKLRGIDYNVGVVASAIVSEINEIAGADLQNAGSVFVHAGIDVKD